MEAWVIVGTIGSVIAAIGTPVAIWAVVLATRADRRSTEVRDIVWSQATADGKVSFTHGGVATARGVTVSLAVDGVTSTARFSEVPSSTAISVPSPEYEQIVGASLEDDARYEAEHAEWERRRSSPAPGPAGFAIAAMGPIPMPGVSRPVEIVAVIAWTYPSGAPERQELRWTERW